MTNPHEDPDRRADDRQGPGTHNSSVVIGAHASVGAAAAGYQAQAVNQGGVGHDNLARVEELLRQLEEGVQAMGGPRADEAIDDIGRVRQELATRQPDRPRISQLMERIMLVVTPVSTLLEVASCAKDLLTAIPH